MSEDQSTAVEYRDIPGFPGYRVGDDGSAWSALVQGAHGRVGTAWRRLNPTHDRRGYQYVTLCREAEQRRGYVHRMVLTAFVGPCPEGLEACHFPNRDPADNRLDNLRWDTKKGNAADKKAQGTHIEGIKSYAAKLTPAAVKEARRLYATGQWTLFQLGDMFGVNFSVMGRAIRRVTWKHV